MPRQSLLLFLGFILQLMLTGEARAQQFADRPMQRVWLLGNTADVPSDEAFFEKLRNLLEQSQERVHLIVSGDLIPGCSGKEPPADYVDRLLNVVRGQSQAEMTLLSGDRDWDQSRPQGWECVQQLEALVRKEGLENVYWPVEDGCPGPETVTIHPFVQLLVLNTQWWNHPHRKPIAADATCPYINEYDILEEINDEIEENQDKNILLAGHFPFHSFGKYGGFFPARAQLLPPVLGSMRVAYHRHVGDQKDIANERFAVLRERLESIASAEKNILFLSGHERNQQVLLYDDNYLINSGAPVKGDFSTRDPDALLASSASGFIEVAFFPDGRVDYRFYRYTGEGFSVETGGPLFRSPCFPDPNSVIPVNNALVPCAKPEHDTVRTPIRQPDSVRVIAGPYYASRFKRFFLGDHFRDTWTTPVEVPVMSLDTTKGGLFIHKRGGGRQTKSLKFKTTEGFDYVFRSVDKDPISALSYDLRSTIIARVTRDQTSSEHPYGALAIAPMLEELDILHATPELFVMPDDPRLGLYQAPFAGMLGMLEERPDDVDKGEPTFASADRILKSHELFQERYNKQRVQVDAREFARARLFDILVGDWSKHEDNWKWAGFRQGDSIRYRPIPRDRDHVFSNLDGLIPWIADRPFAIPTIEHFSHRIRDIRSLTYQARHMDRLLASELSREDWLAAAQYVQQRLNEGDFRRALKAMPPEAYAVSAQEVADKLIVRRNDLEHYAGEFYKLLAEEVDVVGTNKEDHFEVHRLENGRTEVAVYSITPDGDLGPVFYRRSFHPGETKEIRLFGLQGVDRFLICGQAKKAIKLRVIGGADEDQITDDSRVRGWKKKTLIYEQEDGTVNAGTEARDVNTWNEDLYHYERTRFTYPGYSPVLYADFSSFNGFLIGGGITFTRQRYDKPDFSSKHRFTADISTLGNFSVEYQGRSRHVVRRWDLLYGARYARPENYNFFFGIGNNSINDQELFNDDFYQIRYNTLQLNLGLHRDFWKKSFAAFQLGYENNVTVDMEDNILSAGDFFGAGSLNLYNLRAEVEVDLRDHEVLPSRGFRFFAEQELGVVRSQSYGISDLFFEFFASPRRRSVTAGIRAGYSNSFNQVPFYKLPTLGQDSGLRGFQRKRFTGKGRLYFNSELRVFLTEFKTFLIPLEIGLRGFFDTGKIVQPDEDTGEWHSSYGGGFYLVPLSRSYTLSLLLGFSREESAIFTFQIGTNF